MHKLSFAPFEVRQVHAIRDSCGAIDNSNYAETLKILDLADLEKTILYKTSKGEQFSNIVKDILFHEVTIPRIIKSNYFRFSPGRYKSISD